MVEALWMVKCTARHLEGSIALLDDFRIIGGNSDWHFLGTYTVDGRRLYFRAFVSSHGHARADDWPRLPFEAEGIGEISFDSKQIDYVVRITGERETRMQGTFRRIAEMPSLRCSS